MDFSVWGCLTMLVAVLGLSFVGCAFVFVRRMEDRTPAALGEQLGAHKAVLAKLRKRQPLSPDELEYAQEMIGDCRSPLAFAIPATIVCMGSFYVFGCLQQLHGAPPSIRTFIGALPVLGATNLTTQLLRVARLKGRLKEASANANEFEGSR